MQPLLAGRRLRSASSSRDVGALAAVHRLFDAGPGDSGALERGRQQVRVVREHLPQDRQDRLVRQHHLPRRLDKGGAVGQQMLAEALAQHPFPRVELEQRLDRPLGEIGEAPRRSSRSCDDVELLGRPARLAAHVAHVFEGAQVLRLVEHAGEMHPRRLRVPLAQLGPGGDQPLVDRVELVAARASTCSSQYHCTTAASSSAVGVSALYSSSFGGLRPSNARSKRP